MGLQVIPQFEVIDESPDWFVVDKPAPLIVHPTNDKAEPTLLCGVEQLLAFEIENGARPAVVNRLDRDTSGIVLFAMHKQAAGELGQIFEHREVDKEYLAIVHGWPKSEEWSCEEPILRAGEVEPSPIWVRQMIHPDGRHCSTRFQVEKRFERDDVRYAVIRCFPRTGRMHQLRVHLSHGGHPLVGDKLYLNEGDGYLEWLETGWSPALAQKLTLPRHALHACVMRLTWRDQPIVWESPMPEDMREFVSGAPISERPGVVIWSRHD